MYPDKSTIKDVANLFPLIIYPLFIHIFLQLLFYIVNQQDFLPVTHVAAGFWICFYAIRFDIIVVFVSIVPIVLLEIIQIKWKRFVAADWIIGSYVFILMLEIMLSVFDILFFKSNHHRISIEDIYIGIENYRLLWTYSWHYWYWILMLVVVFILTIQLSRRGFQQLRSNRVNGRKLFVGIAFYVLLLFFAIVDFNTRFFVTISSGLFKLESNQVIISANTIIEIVSSRHYRKGALSRLKFMDNAIAYSIQPIIQPIHEPVLNKKNVVIFIIESASQTEFEENDQRKFMMPFLDSIMRKSLVFDNFFANGVNSPTGFDAIIGGLPNLNYSDFFSTGYSYNKTQWFSSMLKNLGYNSSFFYGIKNPGQSFIKTAKNFQLDYDFGYRNYTGGENDFDGYYGIYDDAFFKAASAELNKFPQPFLSVLYNVSTHAPFDLLPPKAMDTLPVFSKSNGKSLRYYNNVVRDFFLENMGQPWFNNTIFIFVADHLARADDRADKSMMGVFRIPMFIYSPGTVNPGHYRYTAQQIDIPITLLHLIGYPKLEFFSLGRNLLDTSHKEGIAYNRMGIFLQAIDDKHLLQYDFINRKVAGYYNYREDAGLGNNLYAVRQKEADSLLLRLQAFWQLYASTMEENKMHPDAYRRKN